MTQRPHIVIAGGNGFLGRALTAYFLTAGHEVTVLTGSPAKPNPPVRTVVWDTSSLGDWVGELDGAAAVINLTGRSVNCRYNRQNRREIMDSRLQPTRIIGQAIARCKHPPRVWLNASTATIYKHTYGPSWTEAGEIGPTAEAKDAFSVEVATAWEQTLDQAEVPSTRKVAMRTAMVFGFGGNSVFPTLRTLARFGLGGRMAHGRQFVSWIHELDFCRAVDWLIGHPESGGLVNICAPNPLTNAEMMATIREAIGMPAGLPAARWMLEIGAFLLRTETELTVKSRRVIPDKLVRSGFTFRFPQFHQTIEDLENKQKLPCAH